jgi:hypothetical protein
MKLSRTEFGMHTLETRMALFTNRARQRPQQHTQASTMAINWTETLYETIYNASTQIALQHCTTRCGGHFNQQRYLLN